MGVTAAGSLLPGSVAANVGVPEAAAAGRSFNRLQSASPEATPSLLDGLGLPEIEVVVTSEGVAMPSSSVAGPMLVVARNDTDGFLTLELAQLPDGVNVDEFIAVSTSQGGAIPEWAGDVVLAGSLELPPKSGSRVGVLLAAGEYTAIAYGEATVASPSTSFTVTGDLVEGAADAVAADLAVSLGAYMFDFPDTVAAGPQVWRVTNTHDVLHHIILFGVDRLYTADEVVAGLVADFSGTPAAAGGFSFETAEFAMSSPILSAGQTIWIEANPEPGFYVALCFLPDPGDELPHAVAGMVDAFEVA
jgi:hypothetical protein